MRHLRRLILYLKQRWTWFYNPVTIGAWVRPHDSHHWTYEVIQDRFRLRKFHIGGDPGFRGECRHVAAWFCRLSPMQIRALEQGVNPRMIQEDKLVAYFPLTGPLDITGSYTKETIH